MLKFFKWVSVSILSLLFIIILVLIFFSNRNLKSTIQPLVQQELSRLFQDSAKIKFDRIGINFFSKKATVTNLKFLISAKDELADTIAFLSLEELSLQLDNSYFDFISLDSLAIQTLKLENPKVIFPIAVEKIKLNKVKNELNKPIIFFLNHLLIHNGAVALYDKIEEQNGLLTTEFKIKSDSILIKDDFSIKKFSPKSLDLSLDNLKYPLKDDFYDLMIEQVNVNFTEEAIGVHHMVFEPKDDQETFAERKGVEKTYIKINTDSLLISGWQTNQVDGFFVEKIKICAADLYAYKDKNYPLPDDRFVPILTDELRKSDIPIHVDTVKIETSHITYEELPEGKDKTGVLFFDKVAGEITNITNVKDSIEKNGNQLKIEASGRFYGKGKLETSMLYSLISPDFKINGSLSTMQISLLNNFIADMFPVRVRSGQVDSVDFTFCGDNLKAAGKLKFYYTGLEIQTQFKEKDGKFVDKAISKVGNFILPQNNPKSADEDLDVALFDHKRDTRKSMFNFWATSIVAGFKATFGIGKVEEAQKRIEEESIWGKMGFGDND